MTRLWGGRFSGGPAEAMRRLNDSIGFDWRLAPYDLAGSRAHARVLHRAGLLDKSESDRILEGLERVAERVAAEEFAFDADDEDVHTALERALVQELGPLGGKLRAGRSRNDQVAADLRMYCRDAARGLAANLLDLIGALAGQAEQHADTPAPGMTHLQHAQPISFGHQLLAHACGLLRDVDRLGDWDRRAAVSPLGAGALSGSALPLDPAAVAAELGFAEAFANSVDAVSDRDFAAELLFACSMIGVHLSRLGEEIVLWSSSEFDWIELDDAYATGSSIMPQKKNADAAELARGKAGRLIGDLTGLLTTLKGLPFSYNKDLQEDKEPLFDALDTLELLLPATAGMVATMRVKAEQLAEAAPRGYALATEIADWLVRDGVPFREAHEIAGAVVARCAERGVELDRLDDAELEKIDARLRPQVRDVLTVQGALAGRGGPGAAGPESVRRQLEQLRDRQPALREWADSQAVPGVRRLG